jgi:hypothetical protein
MALWIALPALAFVAALAVLFVHGASRPAADPR